MRVKLPESLVEEIYQLCLKTKIDWYYFDYYKPKRKTIDIDGVNAIYSNACNLGLDISEELYQWFLKIIPKAVAQHYKKQYEIVKKGLDVLLKLEREMLEKYGKTA